MKVYLKLNNKFCGVDPADPALAVYANRPQAGEWEQATLSGPDANGKFSVSFVAANCTLSMTPFGLEGRPIGTFSEWEQLFATDQPDGLSLLYRLGAAPFCLTIEAI